MYITEHLYALVFSFMRKSTDKKETMIIPLAQIMELLLLEDVHLVFPSSSQ